MQSGPSLLPWNKLSAVTFIQFFQNQWSMNQSKVTAVRKITGLK